VAGSVSQQVLEAQLSASDRHETFSTPAFFFMPAEHVATLHVAVVVQQIFSAVAGEAVNVAEPGALNFPCGHENASPPHVEVSRIQQAEGQSLDASNPEQGSSLPDNFRPAGHEKEADLHVGKTPQQLLFHSPGLIVPSALVSTITVDFHASSEARLVPAPHVCAFDPPQV